ncbi:MAG: hypothetical protein D6737_16085 [Chloroflexi bacterium]|nr:MAG: hypothetical protein D6737_16085 [Chloroflexota bacterium]
MAARTNILRPAARPWQYNVYWIFTIGGTMIIMIGFIIGIILSRQAGGYWSDNSKFARDCALIEQAPQPSGFAATDALIENCLSNPDRIAAESASSPQELQDDLSQLASWPKWVKPFVFVGVMSFMVGIALEFSSIPKLLQNRGRVMGAAYTQIVKR